MRRALTWVCVLLGIGLIAFSWAIHQRGSVVSGLSVVETDRTGLRLPVGSHTLTYTFENPEAVPIRVVGVSVPCELCSKNCRFSISQDAPFTIPPGRKQVVTCVLQVLKPDPFAGQTKLYLATDHAYEIDLTVEGEGVAG